jgi:5'-deoxynucleotidase YfbR-like HD superfamily hydrolase
MRNTQSKTSGAFTAGAMIAHALAKSATGAGGIRAAVDVSRGCCALYHDAAEILTANADPR